MEVSLQIPIYLIYFIANILFALFNEYNIIEDGFNSGSMKQYWYLAKFVTSNVWGKPGYNSNLIPVKHMYIKVSGNTTAVNSELKLAARVDSKTETDSSIKAAKE